MKTEKKNENAQAIYIPEEVAAARYSLSVTSLRRLRYTGKLKCVALSARCIRYSVASLDAHFAALAQGGDSVNKGAAKGKCGAWRARRNLRPTGKTAAANA
jgi:hypothetical protein